jgi:murein tripeptide amidase MpaA
MFAARKSQRRGSQIWSLDPSTGDSQVILADEGVDYTWARLSPDGRWLAFVSNESRRPEVYVRSYPDLDRIWQVSLEGGTDPHWRADSKELVFLGPEQEVLAVAIGGSADGGPGRPELLFQTDRRVVAWAAVADHSRFLMANAPVDLLQRPLRLILDAGPVVRGERVGRWSIPGSSQSLTK